MAGPALTRVRWRASDLLQRCQRAGDLRMRGIVAGPGPDRSPGDRTCSGAPGERGSGTPGRQLEQVQGAGGPASRTVSRPAAWGRTSACVRLDPRSSGSGPLLRAPDPPSGLTAPGSSWPGDGVTNQTAGAVAFVSRGRPGAQDASPCTRGHRSRAPTRRLELRPLCSGHPTPTATLTSCQEQKGNIGRLTPTPPLIECRVTPALPRGQNAVSP